MVQLTWSNKKHTKFTEKKQHKNQKDNQKENQKENQKGVSLKIQKENQKVTTTKLQNSLLIFLGLGKIKLKSIPSI